MSQREELERLAEEWQAEPWSVTSDAYKICADELATVLAQPDERDAEIARLWALLDDGLGALANDGIDIGQLHAPETQEWGERVAAALDASESRP